MTPQQLAPVLVAVVVLGLVLLRNRRRRTLRPALMWVMPALIVPLIGLGLFYTPHAPFGPGAWAALAGALILGAAAGWWRGKTITIEKDADGTLKAQASPIGLILIVGLLAVRAGLRELIAANAGAWHIDAAVATDAFLLFAVGMIVAQRLEIYIRARRIQAGRADSHLELAV